MNNYTSNKYVFGDGGGTMWGNDKYGMMAPDLPKYDLYYKKSIQTIIPGINSIKQFQTSLGKKNSRHDKFT